VEVACEVVARVAVKLCRVVDASERSPPVAVVRPETERVEPIDAVPVAMMLVVVRLPATMTDDEAYTISLNHTGIVVVGVRVRVL
jgi:hypothetical protein